MTAIKNPFEAEWQPRLSPGALRFLNDRKKDFETIHTTFSTEDKVGAVGLSLDEIEAYLQSIRERLEKILLGFLDADLVDKQNAEPVDWEVMVWLHTNYSSKRQLIANIKNHNLSIQTMLDIREQITEDFMLKEETL